MDFTFISGYNENWKFLVKNADVDKTQGVYHVIYIFFGSSLVNVYLLQVSLYIQRVLVGCLFALLMLEELLQGPFLIELMVTFYTSKYLDKIKPCWKVFCLISLPLFIRTGPRN